MQTENSVVEASEIPGIVDVSEVNESLRLAQLFLVKTISYDMT
jgi:hypothetical protein